MKPPDLNLLVYLDALIKYRSATQVAEVLGVSQPGVSAALRRLRELLDDPVMIRTGSRLLPTPKAFDIHQQISPALAVWQELAAGTTPHAKQYAILTADHTQSRVIPTLIALLQRKAPAVSIRVVPASPLHRLEQVSRRAVDLALGHYDKVPDDLCTQPLFEERMVCIMAGTHPARLNFSADTFLAHAHVAVTPTASGPYTEALEAHLRTLGVVRKVAVTTPDYGAAPSIVAQTNYLAILPLSIALAAQRQHGLEIRDVPVPLPALSISMVYRCDDQDNPSLQWLRERVTDACDTKPPPEPAA